jgi:hypothetical protein
VQPHHVEWAVQTERLLPIPEVDGSHRRIYLPIHVEQVAALVERITARGGAS